MNFIFHLLSINYTIYSNPEQSQEDWCKSFLCSSCEDGVPSIVVDCVPQIFFNIYFSSKKRVTTATDSEDKDVDAPRYVSNCILGELLLMNCV